MQQIVIEAMRCGPDDYASYCDKKMTRTKKNGARKQPVNTLELQVCMVPSFASKHGSEQVIVVCAQLMIQNRSCTVCAQLILQCASINTSHGEKTRS